MNYAQNDRVRHAFRSPKRITITIPHTTFEAIAQRSNLEGRSMSNLIAFILERNISQ